jgi:hypothetical protein
MDRTTKLLLAAIAVGLWANAATTVAKPSFAQSRLGNTIDYSIETIARELLSISTGTCSNRKLC